MEARASGLGTDRQGRHRRPQAAGLWAGQRLSREPQGDGLGSGEALEDNQIDG